MITYYTHLQDRRHMGEGNFILNTHCLLPQHIPWLGTEEMIYSKQDAIFKVYVSVLKLSLVLFQWTDPKCVKHFDFVNVCVWLSFPDAELTSKLRNFDCASDKSFCVCLFC